MELYYLNSYGEKIDFTKTSYVVRDIQELLNYDWKHITKQKITGFKKQVSELPIVINVFADSKEEYIEACNHLFEICEKDIYRKEKGKLYYNGQYVKCNLTGSRKKDWCMGVNFNLNYMKLVTEEPMWITEKSFSFSKIDESNRDTHPDFPFDFPFDFAAPASGVARLNNDHYAAAHFKMTIFGPAANPKVMIGGYTYEVNTAVEENEYLVIDSKAGTVVRVQQDGTQVNEFNQRSFDSSVFKKIQPGNLNVNWSGDFGFDVILYQERSEPRWS